MAYRVRTYKADSALVSERVVDVSSRSIAITLAESDGSFLLDISEVGSPQDSQAIETPRRWRRRRKFDVRLFCEEVQALLSAGMSLVETLETLGTKAANYSVGVVLSELQNRLLEGKPFSVALESRSDEFSLILVATVRASEQTGRVAEALDEYLRYDQVLRDLKRKIVNAAIYPSLVIAFGLLVGMFLLVYVIPRFSKVYDDFAQNLSMPTRLLIGLGHLLGDHLVTFSTLVMMFIIFLGFCGHRGWLSQLLIAIVKHIGPVQKILRIFQLSRIFHTMAMLIRGGFPVIEAAVLARSVAFQVPIARAIDHARSAISEGKSLSQGFSVAGLTDSVSERLLKVGERTGRIDRVLEIVAQRYTHELETVIERTTRILEPALMMAVGLLIGGLIVLMYMPIFDLANGVQ